MGSVLVDLYWNLKRSKTDPNRKMKILVNLIADKEDQSYFEDKMELAIREQVDGSTMFYSLNHFNEKNDKWMQHNVIDILLGTEAVMNKFEPVSFVGKRESNRQGTTRRDCSGIV